MIVFGIDPGSRVMGFGVINVQGNNIRCIDYGVFRGVKRGTCNDFPTRLKRLYEGLVICLKKHSPEVVVLEDLFHSVNSKTTLRLGQARGVALLAAANSGASIFEYSPLEVKKAVVGYGRADKQQIQMMVARLLRLEKTPKPYDAADALAVAICHTLRSSGGPFY